MKRFSCLSLLAMIALGMSSSCAHTSFPGRLTGAGFRHSVYGPPHDPGPDYWANVGVEMARRLDSAHPETVWIVAKKNGEGALLNFPAIPRHPLISGSAADENETALQLFDRLNYRVWLQVEPGYASVDELIDLVLARYGHHPSVIGFGVDVEWYRSSSPDMGEAISDQQAAAWLAAIRRHRPGYRLFLKHWKVEKMPPTLREGLLFINDGQMLSGLDEMISEFTTWGRAFAPAPVGFQVGYRADRPWWIRFDDPPQQIGRALLAAIPNTESVFWVDFTALEIFPPPTHPRQPATTTLAERLGYPRDARLLIVHGDDLGMAHSVNAASTAALSTGLVNSASVMAPCPAFGEIAAWAREHPDADLGIHLTLTSEWKSYRWGPILGADRVPTLLDASGNFHSSETAAAAAADLREAETEVRAQIEAARTAGLRPTHLDTHMRTLHMNAKLFDILLRVSREYRIPAAVPATFLSDAALGSRITDEDVVIDRFVTIGPEIPADQWPAFYSNVIANLQPGITELIVHLAYDDEEMRAIAIDHPNWGSAWRQRDFDFLTSDTFRELLRQHDVKLITWREIGKVMREAPAAGPR